MQMHHDAQPGGCRLLLVEDQVDLALLVEMALTDRGNQVTHAHGVREALAYLDDAHFDGAILDIELGDGLVYPVADRLADLGIPYLFASAGHGHTLPRPHQHARFLAKPFHIDALQGAVEDVVHC